MLKYRHNMIDLSQRKAAELVSRGVSIHKLYMTQFGAIDAICAKQETQIEKFFDSRFCKKPRKDEILGAVLSELSPQAFYQAANFESLRGLKLELQKFDVHLLVGENQQLLDWNILPDMLLSAYRRLSFSYGLNKSESAFGLATLLMVIRAGADPKIKKTISLVKEAGLLGSANQILQDFCSHLQG